MIIAVIDEHFKAELEKLPYFHSWKGPSQGHRSALALVPKPLFADHHTARPPESVVASHNDLDNVPVVRLALCLKPESNIDYHLKKQLGLGFGFGRRRRPARSRRRRSLLHLGWPKQGF